MLGNLIVWRCISNYSLDFFKENDIQFRTLDRGMDQAAKQAARTVGTNNLIRYLVLVVVMFILIYTDFANPIFMFCGYMGMKLSAYLNPWLCKIRSKVLKI